MDGQTPCVKIMTTYLALAWWVNYHESRRIFQFFSLPDEFNLMLTLGITNLPLVPVVDLVVRTIAEGLSKLCALQIYMK